MGTADKAGAGSFLLSRGGMNCFQAFALKWAEMALKADFTRTFGETSTGCGS